MPFYLGKDKDMSRQSISQINLMFVISGFLIGTALLLIPTAVIAFARQDALIALFLGMLPSFLLILMLSSLQSKFPGKTLIQYSDEILGPYLGKLASIIYLWLVFHLAVLVLRNTGDFIGLAVLPRTPIVVIQAIVAIIAAFAVRSGIEVITRVTLIIVTLVITFFMIINVMVISSAEFPRMLPFLDTNLKPIIRAAIITASFPFGEIAVFAMIFAHIDSTKTINKYAIMGVLTGFAILALATLRSITVIGVCGSARYVYPALEVVGEVPASFIVQMMLTFNWYLITFVKFVICYYAFNFGLGQLLGLKNNSIVIPVGVIITAFSVYIYQNTIEETYFASHIWPVYSIPLEYGIPFLLWALTKTRA
jgi:spore germination protein KB